jgi:WhiB family redox-sensing transcriptional regulator
MEIQMSNPRKVIKPVELLTPTPRTFDNTPCQTVDPEIFFPDPTDIVGIEKAKTLCGNCDQENKTKCLSFALTNKVRYGVWGGLTSEERYKLVRQQNRSKK